MVNGMCVTSRTYEDHRFEERGLSFTQMLCECHGSKEVFCMGLENGDISMKPSMKDPSKMLFFWCMPLATRKQRQDAAVYKAYKQFKNCEAPRDVDYKAMLENKAPKKPRLLAIEDDKGDDSEQGYSASSNNPFGSRESIGVMERLQVAFDKVTSITLGVKGSVSKLRSYYGSDHPSSMQHVKKAMDH
eukprot:2690833-Karenia_brevis.AAC.1